MKCLDELQERVTHTEKGKGLISLYWYFRKHLVFEVKPPTFLRSQSFRFLSVGTLQKPIAFSFS